MRLPGTERVFGDILHVGIPKLLNGAVTLLVGIYSMRFLDPAVYGVLSIGLSGLALFDGLAGSALDVGTMGLITAEGRYTSPRPSPVEKANVRLKLALGGISLMFFALIGEWLGQTLFRRPGGQMFFLAVTAAGTGVLLLRSVQLYFQARLQFRFYGAVDLTHAALRLIAVTTVLHAGWASAVSIMTCLACASWLTATAAFLLVRKEAAWSDVRPSWSEYRALLRVSSPVLATFSAGAAVTRLDLFFLALRASPTQLGLYGGALTLATIPETLGAYFAPVYLPRILPAIKEGSFPVLFRRTHLRIYLGVAALLAAAYLAGRAVLSLVLPAGYARSIDLVLVLLPGTLAAASFFPLTLNFLMLRGSRAFLTVDLLAAPVLAAAFWYFLPLYGAVGAAWIVCLYRLMKAAVVQGVAARSLEIARLP